MTDQIAVAARAAASRLATEFGLELPADVELILDSRRHTRRPDHYFDPVSVASLIVSVATLAWTIYIDLRKDTPDPCTHDVIQKVRVELQGRNEPGTVKRDEVIEVVVTETVKAATESM